MLADHAGGVEVLGLPQVRLHLLDAGLSHLGEALGLHQLEVGLADLVGDLCLLALLVQAGGLEHAARGLVAVVDLEQGGQGLGQGDAGRGGDLVTDVAEVEEIGQYTHQIGVLGEGDNRR